MKSIPNSQTYFQRLLTSWQHFLGFLARTWQSIFPEPTYAEWLFLEAQDELENQIARSLRAA